MTDLVFSRPRVRAQVSAISVGGLFYAAITAGNSTYRRIEPLTLVGLLYLGIGVPIAIMLRLAESRVATRWESHGA